LLRAETLLYLALCSLDSRICFRSNALHSELCTFPCSLDCCVCITRSVCCSSVCLFLLIRQTLANSGSLSPHLSSRISNLFFTALPCLCYCFISTLPRSKDFRPRLVAHASFTIHFFSFSSSNLAFTLSTQLVLTAVQFSLKSLLCLLCCRYFSHISFTACVNYLQICHLLNLLHSLRDLCFNVSVCH